MLEGGTYVFSVMIWASVKCGTRPFAQIKWDHCHDRNTLQLLEPDTLSFICRLATYFVICEKLLIVTEYTPLKNGKDVNFADSF